MLAERDNIVFYDPTTLKITDIYGESITLSHYPERGDVLRMQRDREDGETKSVAFTGNFHDASRQNMLNFLERLGGMKRISEQEHQELVLVMPHPQLVLRGYVTELSDDWQGHPHPSFFNWSFTFSKSDAPWQPYVTASPSLVVLDEGRDYVTVLSAADTTTARDLAYAYYGKNFDDGLHLQDLIRLNDWTPADASYIAPGTSVRVPV